MKLRRPSPRSHHETIVPLIDVVFFLLVFFMMVGRMDATAPFDVAPPVSLAGDGMPGGGATVSISREGEMAYRGNIMEPDPLVTLLSQEMATDPALLVRINAHREVPLRVLLPLVSRLEAAGARNVVLVVENGLQ